MKWFFLINWIMLFGKQTHYIYIYIYIYKLTLDTKDIEKEYMIRVIMKKNGKMLLFEHFFAWPWRKEKVTRAHHINSKTESSSRVILFNPVESCGSTSNSVVRPLTTQYYYRVDDQAKF